MKHLRAYLYIIGLTLMVAVMAACSVSYKFNGASIDYTKTKTIQIADFPIRSSYVWGPMGPMFNNELKLEPPDPKQFGELAQIPAKSLDIEDVLDERFGPKVSDPTTTASTKP